MNRFDTQSTQQTAEAQNRFDIGATTPQTSTPQPSFSDAFNVAGIPLSTVANSAVKVGGWVLNFLKDVGQSIGRSIVATADTIALDATQVPGLNRILPPAQTFETVHIPNWLQWATGTDKVENLGSQVLKFQSEIQNSTFAQKYGFDQHALPLAIAGISINTGLDLSFFGGEKNLVKQLAKESTDEGVYNILKKIGTDEELAKAFAPKFAATTDLKEIKDGLNILKGAQGLKAGDLLAKEAITKEAPTVIEQATAPAMQPLAEAISKASNFDEFKTAISETPELKNLVETKLPDETALKTFFEESKPYLSATDTLAKEAGQTTGELLPKGSQTLLNLPADEKAAFKPIIAEAAKTVKNKVHILDYLQTPEFVLEKLGLHKEAALLQDAYSAYRKEVKVQIEKVTSWFNEVKDIPEASKHIFQYLDGKAVDLAPIEQKVADEMRVYLKDWAKRLGLPEDKQIAHYITHIFEEDFIKKEFDPELARLITDKIAGSVYDPFLQKRLGKLGYKEDVFAALDAYVKRGTRKVNMDPALAALKKGAETLDVESAKYIQKLTSRINLRPTEVDTLMDNLFKSVLGYRAGVRPVAKLTNTVRTMIYRATLGLNIGSAVRNLTQGINTYAKLGEKYTTIGYATLFNRMATRNLDELFTVGILDDGLIQDRRLGVYKSMLQKMDGALFKFFELAEKINRGSAYFGAKAKYIADGLSEEEAVKAAKRMVRETQFAFGNVDSPVIMSSDLAKMVLQLQTYNVKQAEYFKNMIKNKEFAGLIRWSAASVATVATIGQLFGMKLSQLVPTVNLGGSPIGNLFSSMSDLVSTDAKTRQQAPSKVAMTGFSSLFPAGTQIKKTWQGLEAYNAGKDVTASGKTRYKIPQTNENMLRAGIFGKSTLPQAKEYYNRLDQLKSGTLQKKKKTRPRL